MAISLLIISILFASPSLACSQKDEPCIDASECCPSLCQSVSCVQGFCTGGTCKADGNNCELDCECCGGNCIMNDINPGTCGGETKRLEALDNCGVSCINCRWNAEDCNICCPLGVVAYCQNADCQCGMPYDKRSIQPINISIHYASAFSGKISNNNNSGIVIGLVVTVVILSVVCLALIIFTIVRQRNKNRQAYVDMS